MYVRIVTATMLCLLLAACTTTGGKQTASPAPSLPPPALDQMNEKFLYLAAQDAIRQGNTELAARFLRALTQKEPDARLPRLQLADLLLRMDQYDAALKHIDKAMEGLDINNVRSDEDAEPFLLYTRILAGMDRREQALDMLDTLLTRQPELLEARLLQVRLLASMGRNYEAYQAIRDGIRIKDAPALRSIHADLLIRDGKPAAAEKELKTLLKMAPDEESAVLTLSRLALQQRNTAKAEMILKEFIATHPRAMLSRNALGRILVQNGRLAEAIEIYRDLVRDTGNDAEIASALGLLYYQNQQFDMAAEQFRKIVEANPDDDANRFYLASSLEAMKKGDEAEALYRQIKPASRAYVDAQLRLAGIELGAEKLDAAKKRVRAVLKEHPDAANAYALLSGIYLIRKEYRKLLDETEAALRLPSIPPRLFFNRAIAFETFKQYSDVEDMLKKMLRIEPGNAEALNFLGYTYAEQGIKLDEAEELIKRALAERPDDGYFLDSLAWVHYKRGDYAEAIRVQLRAVGQTPDDPVINEHLGDMYWKNGEQDKAREQWQKALELKHDKPDEIRRKLQEGMH